MSGQINLKDGTYTIEVDMTGGSGRASIVSPAKMEVQNHTSEVEIEWSSSNYDYMIVEDIMYYPINESGNSVFKIPITKYDEPVEVIGDTVAMSKPHEITYQLTFYQDSIHKEADHQAICFGLAAAILLVGVTAVFLKKGTKRNHK